MLLLMKSGGVEGLQRLQALHRIRLVAVWQVNRIVSVGKYRSDLVGLSHVTYPV